MANDIILSLFDMDVKKYRYNLTWSINYIIYRIHILYNSVMTWMYKKFQYSKFSEHVHEMRLYVFGKMLRINAYNQDV